MPKFISETQFSVEQSDSASSIAHHFTGDPKRAIEILRANPNKPDARVVLGEVLNLPDGWTWNGQGITPDVAVSPEPPPAPRPIVGSDAELWEAAHRAIKAIAERGAEHSDKIGILEGALSALQDRAANQSAAIEALTERMKNLENVAHAKLDAALLPSAPEPVV